MELSPKRPDQLGQPTLDRHMNVFVLGREGESSAIQFHFDKLQPAHKLCGLPCRQHPCPFKRPAVCDAPLNVVGVEASIISQ